MRFKRLEILAIAMLAGASMTGNAWADRQVASAFVPDAELTGQAKLRMLGFEIFDAELFAPSGDYNPGKPYALTLEYRRDFSSRMIVDRTVKEMRKQGRSSEQQLSGWRNQMERIFPDVSDGTRITGVRDKNGHARFFRNGAEIGVIDDPAFSDRFFAIWLSDQASNASFRRKLVGAGN